MALIVDWETGERLLAPAVRLEAWTALVAAAGRGVRLEFDKPKILFPVGGTTILEKLIALFAPLCAEFVFVLSPEGAPVVAPEIERLAPGRGRIAIQTSPLGMGDAVACGAREVRTPHVAIVWGDQCALRPASVEFCMRLLEGTARPEAVCPTLLRATPYIHFERDPEGAIAAVRQAREGDAMPAAGESDSGVFFFETGALGRWLDELSGSAAAVGSVTGERNFLPVFPLIDRIPGRLITPHIMADIESVGINTRADAEFLASRLNP